MTNTTEPQRSITEEILDEFLGLVCAHAEFDKETIGKLRQLALGGDLKKAAQVAKAIKVPPEHGI